MPYKPMIVFKPGELRRLQDNAGYTNPQMSNKLHISGGTWDRWLATGRVPAKRYDELCAVLGIEPVENVGEPLTPVQESQIELLRREVRALHADVMLILSNIQTLKEKP